MLGLLVSLFLAGTLSAQSYRVASVNGDPRLGRRQKR